MSNKASQGNSTDNSTFCTGLWDKKEKQNKKNSESANLRRA